jgi:glycosyltransferase involved in cell wall biosynthesis
MENTKFTIVIPTKNRCETFYWSLKSCLEQDYDNFEIIVSDNNSNDRTRQIVEEFNSPKIRYFNTGKSVSMTDNWEFAFNKIEAGFVTYLGDDDGLMPNSLKLANQYLLDFKLDAIIGRRDTYKWINVAEIKQRGMLRFDVTRKTKILDFEKELNSALFKTFDYSKLPCIYGLGFIDFEILKKIRLKSKGVFFNSSIPDIYSSIVVGSEIKKYLYVNESLILGGLSSFSNGNSFLNPNADKTIIESFVSMNTIPFHSKLDFNPSMGIAIAESVLQANDLGLMNFPLDINTISEMVLKEASFMKFEQTYEVVKKSVQVILAKNKVDVSFFESLSNKYKYKSKFYINLKFYLETFQREKAKNFIFANSENDNIYSASLINSKINKNSYFINNPITILFKWILFKFSS